MTPNNVIKIDPADFFCARQCQESIKWCKSQNNPVYDVEIKGEKELYRHFMNRMLGRPN